MENNLSQPIAENTKSDNKHLNTYMVRIMQPINHIC